MATRPGALNYQQAQRAASGKPVEAPVPLTTTEMLAFLGETVSMRQLEYLGTMLQAIDSGEAVTGGGARGATRYWAQPAVHRMQVAVALEQAIGHEARGRSTLPTFARAVFESEDSPPPDAWAVWKSQAVSYVLYSADLFLAIGDGAIVVEVPELWTPEATE